MKKTTLTLAIFCLTQIIPAQINQKTLIENVTIVPTHINQSFANKDVIISDGKIERIINHVSEDTIKYLQRIDGAGKFLMPSMVDAHAHFPEKEFIKTYFLMNLVNGIGTLRSMRGEEWHLEIDKDEKFTPNLILASPPIRRSDSLPKKEQDILVEKYAKKGYDFIKILSIASEDQFNWLVESSKSNNIKLAGHCFKPINFVSALESGRYESIEHFHGIAMLREWTDIKNAVKLTIENNVAYCPTTDWYAMNPKNAPEFKNRNGVEFIDKDLIDEWDKEIEAFTKLDKDDFDKKVKYKESWFDYRIRMTTFSYREGITLLVGPDLTGVYGIPGFGYVNELKHFAKAEVSNRDILRAATYNMAKLRSEEMDWGTIRVGAAADFVLLSNDPIKDIENATNIEGIFLRGKYTSRDDLIKELKKQPKLKFEH